MHLLFFYLLSSLSIRERSFSLLQLAILPYACLEHCSSTRESSSCQLAQPDDPLQNLDDYRVGEKAIFATTNLEECAGLSVNNGPKIAKECMFWIYVNLMHYVLICKTYFSLVYYIRHWNDFMSTV